MVIMDVNVKRIKKRLRDYIILKFNYLLILRKIWYEKYEIVYNVKVKTLYFKNKGIIIREKTIKAKLIEVLIIRGVRRVNVMNFKM